MRWYWLSTLAPLLAGIGIGLFLNFGSTFNPVVYVRADLGTVFFLFGALLSVLSLNFMAFWASGEKRKQMQAKIIIENSEERRRFIQRLDHELKNPLTAILAGIANLKSIELNPSQEIISSIETQVKRLSRLVADLRKLSDLETRPLELSIVNLTDLLEEVFNLSIDHHEGNHRKLNISIPHAPWPLPDISADRDLLLLAIHNLLSNALKFTRPGDTIELRAFEEDQNVIIEVADTGPGIPDSEAPLVWDELYRGVSARGIPGSGLGLSLVKAIVSRHNGKVTLRSRPGQGTVFTIRLPHSITLRNK